MPPTLHGRADEVVEADALLQRMGTVVALPPKPAMMSAGDLPDIGSQRLGVDRLSFLTRRSFVRC